MTATSSSCRAAGPLPSASAVKRSATSTTGAGLPASARAATTVGRSPGSVITSAGSTWVTNPTTSVAEDLGLIGTSMAPTSMSASHASR